MKYAFWNNKGGLRAGAYDLDGVRTQINGESLDRYRAAIRGLAASL